jgi:hypothetical protein
MNTEEISVFDIMIFLVKNRKVIVIFLFMGVLGALSHQYLMPIEYEARTIVEIGNIGGILIEEPDSVAEKVKFKSNELYPNLKTIASKSSNLVEIKNYAQDPEEAIRGVKEALDLLLEDQDKLINLQAQRLLRVLEDIETRKQILLRAGQQVGYLEAVAVQLKYGAGNMVVSKVFRGPGVSRKTGIPLAVKVVIGIIIGMLFSLLWIAVKQWWQINKIYFEK